MKSALPASKKNPVRHRSVLLLLGYYNVLTHRAIARYAGEHGWHLHADMASVPIIPRRWTGDGVIAGLGAWKPPVQFVKSALRRGIPVVDLCMGHPKMPLPRVVGDNHAIGRLAAEHFLERGWRHFAWYSRGSNPVAELRFRGFAERLRAQACPVIKLGRGLPDDPERYDWQKTRDQLAAELARAPKPLAVLGENDLAAAMLMEACRAAGCRIPDDVAVLGVDDNELIVHSVQIPLSSVQHDLDRVGYEGAALLDRLMRGETVAPETRVIPPRGVSVRASTDTYAVNHPAVHHAMRFMKENLSRSIGVEEIAQASGLSIRALQEAFRLELQRGVHDELLLLRVQAARQLLIQTGLSIEEIAAQAGFSHAPHLHRIFRERFGVTPRTFRLNHRTAK